MRSNPNHEIRVRDALIRFAKQGIFPYYSEVGFGARGPRKIVLDRVSKVETAAGRPDITFILRNIKGYPSQIGFHSSKPPTPDQKHRARQEADKIIAFYCPRGTKNPY